MIDRKLVATKLDAIGLYLRRLEPLARIAYGRFSADYVTFNATERLVQLAVDAAVDINNHLLTQAGRTAPPDYYSSFADLATLKVVPDAFARRIARSTGLRNRLVHAYEQADLAILHRALPGLIRDYRRYSSAVRRFAHV